MKARVKFNVSLVFSLGILKFMWYFSFSCLYNESSALHGYSLMVDLHVQPDLPSAFRNALRQVAI
jgi:hypothetical protein